MIIIDVIKFKFKSIFKIEQKINSKNGTEIEQKSNT